MSGRLEQLARQIRRLRTSASDPARTLQRALHLAADLATEYADGDFAALAAKGTIDSALADRLAALSAKERVAETDVTADAVVDLDVFLRSVELGHPAAPLALSPLESAPKLPPGTHRASVNVSGRVISVVGRDGRAFVLVDDKPIGQPFDLREIPMSAGELQRDDDGTVHLQWPNLHLVVAPDFTSVTVQLDLA